MKHIALTQLRTLLKGKYYRRRVGVVASISGGWFVKVPR